MPRHGDDRVNQVSSARAPHELFQDMIDQLRATIIVDAVILFGSQATGMTSEHSDYDLVIIGRFTQDRWARVRMVLAMKPRVPLDVFCFTPEEFRKAFDAYDLTAVDAIGDGIVLHGDRFVQPYKEEYQARVRAGMHKRRSVLVLPP